MGAPEGGWEEFLATYDERRLRFEADHPDLRTFRLVALVLLGFMALAVVSWFVFGSPPTEGRGWVLGHPPTSESRPGVFGVVSAVTVAILIGFLGYGGIRMREDGAFGQIALAVGLLGPAGALVGGTACVSLGTLCAWAPGAAVLGTSWLILWLVLGLFLDYRTWTREATG